MKSKQQLILGELGRELYACLDVCWVHATDSEVRPADLDWIQSQGLLAVKLAQIFALRSDLLSVEKCRQLQQLYQHASSIPSEEVFDNLEKERPRVSSMPSKKSIRFLLLPPRLDKYTERA